MKYIKLTALFSTSAFYGYVFAPGPYDTAFFIATAALLGAATVLCLENQK